MSEVKTITLDLRIEEVNSILAVLGDLPSKTGAWPLMMKIKQQAESQAPAADEAQGAEAA